jgi:hypothetical protein
VFTTDWCRHIRLAQRTLSNSPCQAGKWRRNTGSLGADLTLQRDPTLTICIIYIKSNKYERPPDIKYAMRQSFRIHEAALRIIQG